MDVGADVTATAGLLELRRRLVHSPLQNAITVQKVVDVDVAPLKVSHATVATVIPFDDVSVSIHLFATRSTSGGGGGAHRIGLEGTATVHDLALVEDRDLPRLEAQLHAPSLLIADETCTVDYVDRSIDQ